MARGRKPRKTVYRDAPTDLRPAEYLDDYGRQKFEQLAAQIATLPGMLERCDADQLSLTCLAYMDLRDAEQIVRECGQITHTNDGKTITVHPATRLKQDAIRRIIEGLDRFGLNPRSRKRMGAAESKQDDDGGFAQFIGVVG